MAREDDIRKIVAGARAKGLGDDQIRALVARYNERAQQTAQPQAEPRTESGSMLPTAGSFVGSLVGTVGGVPGRIAGAGIGGALGKGAELFFDEKDDSLGDSLKAMGTEGAKQGAYEAAGGALGKGIGLLGKGAYKAGVSLLPRTLKEAHPKIAETGFREGIALTKRGAAKAGEAVKASASQADDMIATAERAGGAPVATREVIRELRPVGQTLKKRAELGLPDEVPALAQRAKTLRSSHPQGIPLSRAQDLKREAQAMADTAYKTQQKGGVIKDDVMMGNEAIARGLRKGIEQRVPDVAAVNARTQGLIGVREGAEHASGTGHILSRAGGATAGALLGLGGGVLPAAGAALAGGVLTTPQGLSSLGVGLKRTGKIAEFTPEMMRAAILMDLLGGEPQNQP
jgi:hypothetical protein